MNNFRVRRKADTWTGEDGWIVNLPHQCDAWDIAGGDGTAVSHEAAVKAFAAFLNDGMNAYRALVDGNEYEPDDAA